MTQNQQSTNPVQVEQYLGGLDYPAGKQAILDQAKQQGAESEVLKLLECLPDHQYESPVDVSQEIGKLH